jgi:hypothetical protein
MNGGTSKDDSTKEAHMTSKRLVIGLTAINLVFLVFIVGQAGRKQLRAEEASWQNASDIVARFFKIEAGR